MTVRLRWMSTGARRQHPDESVSTQRLIPQRRAGMALAAVRVPPDDAIAQGQRDTSGIRFRMVAEGDDAADPFMTRNHRRFQAGCVSLPIVHVGAAHGCRLDGNDESARLGVENWEFLYLESFAEFGQHRSVCEVGHRRVLLR
jgi:hypothetical protein